MKLDFEQQGNRMCLAMAGRLDAATSPEVETQIVAALDRSGAWLVDLSEVVYISSAGLRVLLLLAKRLQGKNGKLALCGLSDGVREVFDISGFSLIFKIFPDRAPALDFLA